MIQEGENSMKQIMDFVLHHTEVLYVHEEKSLFYFTEVRDHLKDLVLGGIL